MKYYKVHAVAALIAAGFFPASNAADNFDLQGITVDMPQKDFLERANSIATEKLKPEVVVFQTNQGKRVDESKHVTQYTFKTKHSFYTVKVARKPMDQRVKRIRREVTYDKRDLRSMPSFESYEAAVLKKYGRPIVVEKGRTSSINFYKKYLFSNHPLGTKCKMPKERISDVDVRSSDPSDYSGCGKTLVISISAYNQPNHPVHDVYFRMDDYYVEAKDDAGYMPYWNKWMNDYLSRHGPSNTAPSL